MKIIEGKRPLSLGKPYAPQPSTNNTNFESWMIVKSIIEGYGPTSYWALVKTCMRHKHGTAANAGLGGRPYINYLLKMGYLVEQQS